MLRCGLTSGWQHYMTCCIGEPSEARQQIGCLNSFEKNVIQEPLLLEASGSERDRWDRLSRWQSHDTGFISAWICGLVRLSNTWFSPECRLHATRCTKEKQFVLFFSVNSRVEPCAACERSGLVKRVWRSRLIINTLTKVHWLLKRQIAPCNCPSITLCWCPSFGKMNLLWPTRCVLLWQQVNITLSRGGCTCWGKWYRFGKIGLN